MTKWYKNGEVWFWIIVPAIIIASFTYSHFHQRAEARKTSTGTHSKCSPDYKPCIPNVDYDLDCADVGKRVTVIGTDVYGLDGDGDGIGCESY